MIEYICNLLGVDFSSGSIEYYLVLIACLNILVACSVALIRFLMSPVDLLIKSNERKGR